MWKSKRSTLWYWLIAIIFISWIIFLFLDLKGINIELPKSFSTITGWKLENQEENKLNEEDEDYSFLSGFLQQDDFLKTGNIEGLGNIKEKIALLEKIFPQQQTYEIAQLLIDAYMLNNQYDKVKRLYNTLPNKIKSQLDPWLIFKIGLNSFSQTSDTEYDNLKRLLQSDYNRGVFDITEKWYYESVFLLIEWKYDAAKEKLEKLKQTDYQNFVDSIEEAFAQYNTLKDVPDYYLDGLVAYQLMNNGFLAGAKKIAIRLVNEHEDYILPHQILANVDFMMNKRESSARYFLKLLDIDRQERSLYLYYLWICYYYMGDYSKSVLYLSQITDITIMIDSDRYLILSYIALWEEDRVLWGWQRLLGYPSIKASDFYSFFEEAFWKPYRNGKSNIYLEKNKKLIDDYFTACDLRLTWEDSQICSYWQLGLLAIEQEIPTAEQQLQLSRFARKYAKPEFFQYLGDIELASGEIKEATLSYMRALWLTKSEEERAYLKERILRANKIEE